ncbi:hypothetical protein EV199_2540, partial [Pseudobacter ginsenosidimutans]
MTKWQSKLIRQLLLFYREYYKKCVSKKFNNFKLATWKRKTLISRASR